MHDCPACGYDRLKEPPRSPSGGGSYEICPACGFQNGVDDDDKGISPAAWAKQWIAAGADWSSQGIAQPKGWKSPGKPTAKKAAKKSVKKASQKAVAKKKS